MKNVAKNMVKGSKMGLKAGSGVKIDLWGVESPCNSFILLSTEEKTWKITFNKAKKTMDTWALQK